MPDEKTELDTIAELVAVKLKEQQDLSNKEKGITSQVTNTPQNEPLELNLLGQKFTFKDKAEMEAALAQTFQKTAAENETLRQQLAKNPAYVTGKEKEEEFNQDHYVELMGKGSKGILEAHNYALNHSIFGGKEPNAAEAIKTAVQEVVNTKATLAVYQFRERHPEFQLTPETTKVIDGIRAELRQPFNLDGLEAAYGVAQARGLMPSPQLLNYQKQLADAGIKLPEQQTQQTNLGFQPPPQINRGNSGDKNFDLIKTAETIPLEQLELVLRQQGLL